MTSQSLGTILIADDQTDIREALALVLRAEGFATIAAASPAEASLLLDAGGIDALLLDLNFSTDTTSGEEGLRLLASVKTTHPSLPVVVLTGWGSIDLAVRALRVGAADFIEKPWENTRLITVLRNQLTLFRTRGTSAALTQAAQGDVIGVSPAMRQVLSTVTKIAPAEVPVLITGESGTGKGLIARHIAAQSRRAEKPFVTLDLGAVPETLIESELFGHVRGAFTDARTDRIGRFEIADEGILFLDEIGNASLATQARLLSVLEDGLITRVGEARPRRVNVRIIAASNADLHQLIDTGHFRRDLLFRLNTVELALPPLRARGDDVLLLAAHYLALFASRHGRTVTDFAPDALAALATHRWPGNVRELAHVIERAVLLADGSIITPSLLRLVPAQDTPLERMTLGQVERYLIQRTLTDVGGDVEAAARRLGLSRSAFYRRLALLRT